MIPRPDSSVSVPSPETENRTRENIREEWPRLELPDAPPVLLGAAAYYQCPEALFRPSLAGVSAPGLHEAIAESIAKCDLDLHADLYESVVLAGGCTLLDGLVERLTAELERRKPHGGAGSSRRVHVSAPPGRELSAWTGGSVLASLATFQGMWIHRAEYVSTTRSARPSCIGSAFRTWRGAPARLRGGVR